MTLGPLRFTNALGGTADFIYPGPAIDMQSPASAGAIDGASYLIYSQSFDMSQWEIAIGAYTAASGTFSRTTINANYLGTTAKVNFGNPPQVFLVDVRSGARELLQSARTYYVRSDGNDTNSGLVDSSGGAFLTIQRAFDVTSSLDLNGFNVTIQVRSGTFAGAIVSSPWLGKGTVTLTGDTTTPSNCFISESANDCVLVRGFGSKLSVQGFKLACSDANHGGLTAQDGGVLTVAGQMEYGTCALTTVWARGGTIIFTASGSINTVSGTSQTFFFWLTGPGSIINNQTSGITFRFNANMTVASAFAQSDTAGVFNTANAMTFDLATFSKTVTGKRYNAASLGLIQVFGAGVNFFPGTVAGTGTNPGTTPFGLYT